MSWFRDKRTVILAVVLFVASGVLVNIYAGALYKGTDTPLTASAEAAESGHNTGNGGDAAQRGVAPVVILVVDDFDQRFQQIVEALPPEPFEMAAEQLLSIRFTGEDKRDGEIVGQIIREMFQKLGNEPYGITAEFVQADLRSTDCALTPEGTSFFATGGTSFFATGGTGFFATGGTGAPGAAHGVRVSGVVEELLRRYGGGLPIRVERVDTGDFAIEVIARNLRDAVNEITSREPGTHIVVNMSFAVIPCRAVPDLAAYERLMATLAPKLGSDLNALKLVFQNMVDNGVWRQPLSGRTRLVYEVCPEGFKPLEGQGERGDNTICIGERDGQMSQIVLVAASGNGSYVSSSGGVVGMDFPFYPAAWGGVTAVSASDDAEDFFSMTGPAFYSNAGDVMMPGIWKSPAGNVEQGTSFAAPRYSVYMALLLSAPGKVDIGCGPGRLPAPIPPSDWAVAPAAPPNQPLRCP